MMTTNSVRLTKKDMFTALLAHFEREADFSADVVTKNDNTVAINADDVCAFLLKEIGNLDKKSNGEKKPSAAVVENAALRDAIYDGMEANRLYTIEELVAEIPALSEASTHKVSALMGPLCKEGKVNRIVEKRKTYYEKVVTEG